MCTRVHVSCRVCVEYDEIPAAVHVTILVPREHLMKLKTYQGQDVVVKYVILLFLFAIYIVQD